MRTVLLCLGCLLHLWGCAHGAARVERVNVEMRPGNPVLCMAGVPEAGPIPRAAREPLAQAREQLRSGDLVGAQARLDGLPAHPAVDATRAMLALVRESPEEWQHASALYAQLIEAFPSNPCLLSAGGVANLRSGQLEQGMEKIALAAQLDKEDVDIGLLHALVLLETDVEGATALLQRHRERNPKHVGVNYLLAMILLNGQQIEQAIPYLERADDGGLDLDAMLLEAYFLVGKMETYLPLASEMGLPLGDGGAIASAQDPWTAYFSRIGILPTQGLTAVIRTNMGEMRCRLYVREAPVAVANFVGLSDGSQPWTHPTTGARQTTPLYPGTVFHRVIPGFMIQGGDPLGTGSGGPGYEFPDEVHKRSEFDHPGVLALANKGPGGSNGSQWFITEAATPHLNGLHTILGECDEASVEVVRQIARVPRDKSDRPTDPVVLEQISFEANDSPL